MLDNRTLNFKVRVTTKSLLQEGTGADLPAILTAWHSGDKREVDTRGEAIKRG